MDFIGNSNSELKMWHMEKIKIFISIGLKTIEEQGAAQGSLSDYARNASNASNASNARNASKGRVQIINNN